MTHGERSRKFQAARPPHKRPGQEINDRWSAPAYHIEQVCSFIWLREAIEHRKPQRRLDFFYAFAGISSRNAPLPSNCRPKDHPA